MLINNYLNLINIQVVKKKKYDKLLNIEKNFKQTLVTIEEFKMMIKDLIIMSENLSVDDYQNIRYQI